MNDFQQPSSEYIVYADESGDHSLTSIDKNYPVFVLSFCLFRQSEYAEIATTEVKKLKFRFFGHDQVILHEREIRKAEPPFSFLRDKNVRPEFFAGMNNLMESVPFSLLNTLIDKNQVPAKLRERQNAYHMALSHSLEALYSHLEQLKAIDKPTWIVFESRGKREDMELELEFRRIVDGDNCFNAQLPFKFISADKQSNSCGLQIADLVARPAGIRYLNPDKPNRAYDILKEKLLTDLIIVSR